MKKQWCISWSNFNGTRTDVFCDADSKEEAIEYAKHLGYTEPKWWQWWRWSDRIG